MTQINPDQSQDTVDLKGKPAATGQGRVPQTPAAAVRLIVTAGPVGPHRAEQPSSWHQREGTPPTDILDFLDRCHGRIVSGWRETLQSVTAVLAIALGIGVVAALLVLVLGSVGLLVGGAVGAVGGGGGTFLWRMFARRQATRAAAELNANTAASTASSSTHASAPPGRRAGRGRRSARGARPLPEAPSR
jgi:hypothetical protein